MGKNLFKVDSQVKRLVTSSSYAGLSSLDLGDYVLQFKSSDGRVINIDPLLELISIVMQKFADDSPDKSDGWFASRVHASLRLFRSEAACLSMWEYLSICVPEVRSYIIWRWGGDGGEVRDTKRIYGSLRRHALARLWWSAELTRSGSDYAPVEDIFLSQDAANYLTDTLAFNNRPAAVAFSRVLKSIVSSGGKAKSAVDIAKSLNHVLVTVVLDSLAPDPGVDMDAYERWVNEEVDETLMINSMPVGPNEAPVEEDKIKSVEVLMLPAVE